MKSNVSDALDQQIKQKYAPKVKLKFNCGFCGKKYVRHSLFERHYSVCKTKHQLTKKRRPTIQTDKEEVCILSLNRKLDRELDILYVQSERMKTMEKRLESRNKIIRNKLDWLLDNVNPPHTFKSCLNNIVLHQDLYDYVTKYGYLKGYCDLVDEMIDPYKEMIYSFTTSSITYIYIDKTQKWVEFTKAHAFQLYCRLQQKLIQIALNVTLPDNIRLLNNSIIYGTNNQSIDIKTKIKSYIHKKTLINSESLLQKYETTEE